MDIDILRQWLQKYPGWGAEVQVDTTGAAPVSGGLFPRGTEEVSRTEDVLGNVRLRVRDRFLLARHCADAPEDNARWLLGLQQWVRAQCAGGTAPVFGARQRIRAEKGRLESSRSGTAEYTAELTVEYTVTFPNGDLVP